jgi:hypothetical protein
MWRRSYGLPVCLCSSHSHGLSERDTHASNNIHLDQGWLPRLFDRMVLVLLMVPELELVMFSGRQVF